MIGKVILFLLAIVVLNATAPTYRNVIELYVATFGRAPDVPGIKYWVNDSGLELEGIAASFMEQPESAREYYPDGTYDADYIVDRVYLNLFDRPPESAGKDYWVKYIESDFDNVSVFILAVINGAQDNDANILNWKANDAYNAIKDDLQDGSNTCPTYYHDGSSTILTITLGDGRIQWQCSYFSDTGRLYIEKQKVEGKFHGPSRTYYENGDLRLEGNYWNGKMIGTWYSYKYDYKENRTIRRCQEYDSDGIPVGPGWYDC